MGEDRLHCYLWRCAGFGPTVNDLRRSRRLGYGGTVEHLVHYHRQPEDAGEPDFATVIPPGFTLTLAQVAGMVTWWFNRMVTTRRPLEEKLTLFWHGHFTTSLQRVFSPGLLLRQNQLLRQHASGRFEELLMAISRDPAMLIYLDGHSNHKDHPNENYARELLELFTLGEGHYGEGDVQAAARAFTGWGIDLKTVSFRFDPQAHDDGPKRFLGHTGALGGEDVVRILAAHPATARRLSARLFRFFTGEDAPPAEVERLAGIYALHHGQIGSLVQELLLGDAFRSCAGRRQGFRSPVEFAVGSVRALSDRFRNLFGPGPDWGWLEPVRMMGQLPWLPPSVRGWIDGPVWFNSATLLDRINYAHRLVAESPGARELTAGLEHFLRDATPAQATERMLWVLGLPDARPATRAVLTRCYAEQAGQGRGRAGARMLELILAGPDFQVR